LFISEISRKTL